MKHLVKLTDEHGKPVFVDPRKIVSVNVAAAVVYTTGFDVPQEFPERTIINIEGGMHGGIVVRETPAEIVDLAAGIQGE